MSLLDLKIKDAEALAKRYGCDGVIILAVDKSRQAANGVSYGRNRKLCDQMGEVLDRVCEATKQELARQQQAEIPF